MAQRLNYGSMDKAKPKADEASAKPADAPKEPAADGADKAPSSSEPAPKADGGEPAKGDAKPADPKAEMRTRHGAAVKTLREGFKTERRDMHKRHLGDYESMQARHDKAIEDMMSAHDAELTGPDPDAPDAPAGSPAAGE